MKKKEIFNMQPKRSLVLVVDDKPKNLRAISNSLKRRNFEVAVAQSGATAISNAKKFKPNLILLDLVMPDMDGYEVIETLSKSKETFDIPIILMSSKAEAENIIQGLQLGAVDYIKKDASDEEIVARIKTHLKLKHYMEELESKNNELSDLNKELKYLNQDKNEFLGIAAHDLKNPINNIALIAKILANNPDLSPEDISGFAEDITLSAERMLELIKNLLDINAIEQGEMKLSPTDIDIARLISYVIDNFRVRAEEKEITINMDIHDQELIIFSDNNAIIQILDNLISNAVKYSPRGSNVLVGLHNAGDSVSISVQDEGPGFTADDLKKMYQKFSRLSAQPTGGENSTGLGLSIVKKIVDVIGGKIECECKLGKGSKFIVLIPKKMK